MSANVFPWFPDFNANFRILTQELAIPQGSSWRHESCRTLLSVWAAQDWGACTSWCRVFCSWVGFINLGIDWMNVWTRWHAAPLITLTLETNMWRNGPCLYLGPKMGFKVIACNCTKPRRNWWSKSRSSAAKSRLKLTPSFHAIPLQLSRCFVGPPPLVTHYKLTILGWARKTAFFLTLLLFYSAFTGIVIEFCYVLIFLHLVSKLLVHWSKVLSSVRQPPHLQQAIFQIAWV